MARPVRFPVDAFERGRLPHVCALSGVATDHRVQLTVTSGDPSGWLLFGVVPYLLARRTTRSATGVLPLAAEVSAAVIARQRQTRTVALATFGVAMVGLVMLLAGSLGLNLFVLGFALLFAGALAFGVARVAGGIRNPLRHLTIEGDGRWIRLGNAADSFADAVTEDLAADRI
jgi:hypothetical protein